MDSGEIRLENPVKHAIRVLLFIDVCLRLLILLVKICQLEEIL